MLAIILIVLEVLGALLLCVAGVILYISWAIRVAVFLDDRTNLPGWVSMLIGLVFAPFGVLAGLF